MIRVKQRLFPFSVVAVMFPPWSFMKVFATQSPRPAPAREDSVPKIIFLEKSWARDASLIPGPHLNQGTPKTKKGHPLNADGPFDLMAPRVGLEPTTLRLTACVTSF